MVPRPDYRRVRGKLIATMNEQLGRCFTVPQLQGAAREPYDLVEDVAEYMVKQKEIRKHPDGGYCIGDPIHMVAKVKGDEEDVLGPQIRELYRDEKNRRSGPQPELGE